MMVVDWWGAQEADDQIRSARTINILGWRFERDERLLDSIMGREKFQVSSFMLKRKGEFPELAFGRIYP
jgi:hypothetical protein